MMRYFSQKLIEFWHSQLKRQVTSLISTIGILRIVSCLPIIGIVLYISDQVLKQEAFTFDQAILLWIHSFSNPTLDWIMYYITRMNDPDKVLAISMTAVAIMLWRRYYQEAKILTIISFGTLLLSFGLKLVFAKPRPTLWQSAIKETTFSYPSGHALVAIAIYGFLAYVLATRWTQFSWLIYLLAVSGIGAIGFSRLYFGVHCVTDIIGGYGMGYLWLTFWIAILKLQQKKYKT